VAGDLLDAVEASFAVHEQADGTYEGPNVPLESYGRLFGGQLLAQALGVAAATTEGKVPKSLHLLFLAEGRPGTPVCWSVDELHSGRSFASRALTACQGDRMLVAGLASMHATEPGLEYQEPPPDVQQPEELKPIAPTGAMPLEMRVDGDAALDSDAVGAPCLSVWMRVPSDHLPGSPLVQQQLLAYCSDATMMAAAMRPHPGVGFGSPAIVASAVTSHTISFHRPVALDDWMLFVQHSPVASGGRAYIRGDWFQAGGLLVASCAQEAMIRVAGVER